MRQFSGRGGYLYELGDPFVFHDVRLWDCGDGWDWQAPEGLRYWLPEGLSFEVFDGGKWVRVGAMEVHHRSARAVFERCLAGLEVRASGICHPTSLIASGESWELQVEVSTRERSALGAESPEYTSVVGNSIATIHGIEIPIDQILAVLPIGGGAFIGKGKAIQGSNVTTVLFNEEGVRHDLW